MASENPDLKATPSSSATAGGDALGSSHLASPPATSTPAIPAKPATPATPAKPGTPATPAKPATPAQPSPASSDAKAAAASGAEAVRDAVNKVANAAVDAVRSAAQGVGPQGQFHVSGTPGGYFLIRGDGFSGGGGVTFGGVGAEITAWGDERIEGKVPAGAKPGDEVVVMCGDPDKKQYGRF